jgi:molecular chaperone DnaK (HSP70)
VVGIDLGTSNSAVAVLDDGSPRVLKNGQGIAAIPSIVAVAQASLGCLLPVNRREAAAAVTADADF